LLGQKSERALAIENFEKFLTLWKDADPGIAEIDNASSEPRRRAVKEWR
jgi:hypothetical protein